ncbi:MAG: HAD family hydrolase, partial [Rhodospirillales bacterium]|nr:HAD family hydrolase [Rhodospirillales bacterium]
YMGVVSNKTGPLLRAEAAHLGWDQYFGAIVGAGDAAKDKPAPDPIFQSAEPGGYDPSQGNWADIWYVGDTEIDMICAANSGLIPILLRQTPAADGEFGGCPPELVFTAGGDLCRFLDLLEN